MCICIMHYAYAYVFVYVYVCMCMYMCIYVFIYTICICICIFLCLCIYVNLKGSQVRARLIILSDVLCFGKDCREADVCRDRFGLVYRFLIYVHP